MLLGFRPGMDRSGGVGTPSIWPECSAPVAIRNWTHHAAETSRRLPKLFKRDAAMRTLDAGRIWP
jgi:hypothetical protein